MIRTLVGYTLQCQTLLTVGKVACHNAGKLCVTAPLSRLLPTKLVGELVRIDSDPSTNLERWNHLGCGLLVNRPGVDAKEQGHFFHRESSIHLP
jgi:hypothetical protein